MVFLRVVVFSARGWRPRRGGNKELADCWIVPGTSYSGAVYDTKSNNCFKQRFYQSLFSFFFSKWVEDGYINEWIINKRGIGASRRNNSLSKYCIGGKRKLKRPGQGTTWAYHTLYSLHNILGKFKLCSGWEPVHSCFLGVVVFSARGPIARGGNKGRADC